MAQPQSAPYGSWRSPIAADEVFAKSVALGEVRLDGRDVYWSETRPDGCTVIVRRTPDGQTTDVTSPPFQMAVR